MQKMRDQIKDEELKNMMDVDEQDDNESESKIKEKFVKGAYENNEENMSDSGEVSLEDDNENELDDDEEEEEDLNENMMDDEDAKDF